MARSVLEEVEKAFYGFDMGFYGGVENQNIVQVAKNVGETLEHVVLHALESLAWIS